MDAPFPSPYLVTDPDAFRVADEPTGPPEGVDGKAKLTKALRGLHDELDDLQRLLYADDRYSLLLVFQAMDAAGKDGTIRAVLRGANPAGFQVSAFKQPSTEELDHEFLWRSARRLPERGRIGVFNRSYYEEVLVVRVHPEYLGGQQLPGELRAPSVWENRYESIRSHEKHLAANGTLVVKFWLNVSRGEQRRRFLARSEDTHKQWKFSANDVSESRHWDACMDAYEKAIRATSRPWAPWYVIPADSKPYMRGKVAEIVVGTLASLGLSYPSLTPEELDELREIRAELREDPTADPGKARARPRPDEE